MQEPRFLMNDQGEPVEVVLDVTTYKKLLETRSKDPRLLSDLSQEQLEALAEGYLTNERETTLYELIDKKKTTQLSLEETALLKSILEHIDQLALLKARALYTLHQTAKK